MDRKAFEDLLRVAVEDGVSDIIFAAGNPPLIRYSGNLIEMRSEALEPRQTELLARLVAERHGTELDLTHACELSYELEGVGRFRVSIFRVRGALRLVLRVIPLEVRTLAELNLPPELELLAQLKRGLVLVTGATGQGKSTTISALLERINQTRKAHIITIEDPIEYTYRRAQALITQREIGDDVADYQTALRQALRQSPDVIMVGEVRDLPTFDAALTAAETGHLVLSAVHTADAISTFTRLLGLYPLEERATLRNRLALNLAAIVSLRLLPRTEDGGRIPAVEILRVTPAIADCLRSPEKLHEIYSHMQRGRDYYGMRTFDQHILELFNNNRIDRETALAASSRPAELERALTLQGEP